MTGERWRLFVAIPIGAELRRAVGTAVEEWRTDGTLPELRWMNPDAWHVTLAFLGSVDTASVGRVVERLAAVAEGHAAMPATTGGLGAFPTPSRARVLWYGIHDEQGGLPRLAADVAAALGVGASRPPRPHLTLARARREPVDLRSWLASASAPAGMLAVDRLDLRRSHTGRSDARYETLASLELGVSAGV
jgi:2'-5' RNA ligase